MWLSQSKTSPCFSSRLAAWRGLCGLVSEYQQLAFAGWNPRSCPCSACPRASTLDTLGLSPQPPFLYNGERRPTHDASRPSEKHGQWLRPQQFFRGDERLFYLRSSETRNKHRRPAEENTTSFNCWSSPSCADGRYASPTLTSSASSSETA